jgi:non-ribosomal peptide synthase protein (TIGR01720 family)
LNNPAQSASVFISPPTWYPSFRRSSSNPFYKTGDLARYTNGGELQFVARKDFQVKLRGQRIELGEVEQHLSYAFLEASDAVAEIITPVGGNSMLVAFVCLARGNAQEKAENIVDSSTQDLLLGANEQFCLAVQAAEQQLSKSIPEFMVPVVFFPIRYVPRTAHKKTDRRRLREAVMSLTSTELEKYNYLGTSKQQPWTEGEILLQRVWARVLNKAVESIGVHDSFFRLGGDSITAMQVASQSSGAGMTITVADIFRYKTISQLGLLAKKAVSAVYTPEVLNSSFALSPIQKLFFQLSPQGHNHFSQDFLLRLTRPVSSAQVAYAVRQMVRNHSILRARFQNHRGEWMQTIGTDTAGSYHYQEHSTTSVEAADVIFSSSQMTLNITNGPIVSADLINIREEQYLFLVAHHLVIDLVSWRIILGDLEEFLTTGEVSSPPSLSFQVWCRLQEEYAKINLDPEQAMLADPMRPVLPGDYWGISGQTNLLKDVVEGGFVLDEKTTSLLFQEANTAFQTQPVELFLAALLHSFTQTFSDRSAPIIWNEGHGREPWDVNIDVSRTVGWFTTMWPLYTHVDEPGLLNIVRQMKDNRRSVPSNGWAHFTSSLHPKAQRLSKDGPKEILFNYLGQYQQLERSDSLFQWATRPTASHIAGDMQRFALIDVSASLSDNCLRFDFWYNKHAAANRPISDWITNCERSLKSIAIDFPSRLPMFTLSDFPLMPFNYDTLDVFITQTLPQCGISSTEVENIYPCSPIQRGILLSQAKNYKLYQSFVIWKIRANSISSQVEVGRTLAATLLIPYCFKGFLTVTPATYEYFRAHGINRG